MDTGAIKDKVGMYKLTGKYMNWGKVIALQIESDDKVGKLVKIEDVQELIRRGQINGCSLIEYKNQVYIKSEYTKIAELPFIDIANSNKFKLSGKIVREGKTIGYTVTDDKGKVYRFSSIKVWDMARQNIIDNVKAYVLKDNKVLVGLDFKITDIGVEEV